MLPRATEWFALGSGEACRVGGERPMGARGKWVVAAAATFALIAAACSSGTSGGGGGPTSASASTTPITAKEPTSPVSISFAAPGYIVNSPNIKKFAKQFEKLHPNITIEFQSVPAEQEHDKLLTQVAAGTAPDTAYVDSSIVSDFGLRNALLGLNGYLAGSKLVDQSDFVPAFARMNTVTGQMYGLPFDGESTALFYRTDMFQAAGISSPPKTWDEMQADAQKLTNPAKKQYGFIMFAPEAEYYWLPFLYSAGGQLASPNGTPMWDSPAGDKSANFFIGLKKYSPPDAYNSNSYDGRVFFANGQVAMYEAGAWFAGTTQSEFPKIKGKWAIAPIPQDQKCATTIAGDSLAIFSSSKNQDAAWKWIEFLDQKKNVLQWNTSPGQTLLPPLTSLLNDPETTFKNAPVLKGFVAQMKCGININVTNPNWAAAEQKLKDRLGDAVFGKLSPTEALDEAKQQALQVLKQA